MIKTSHQNYEGEEGRGKSWSLTILSFLIYVFFLAILSNFIPNVLNLMFNSNDDFDYFSTHQETSSEEEDDWI